MHIVLAAFVRACNCNCRLSKIYKYIGNIQHVHGFNFVLIIVQCWFLSFILTSPTITFLCVAFYEDCRALLTFVQFKLFILSNRSSDHLQQTIKYYGKLNFLGDTQPNAHIIVSEHAGNYNRVKMNFLRRFKMKWLIYFTVWYMFSQLELAYVIGELTDRKFFISA